MDPDELLLGRLAYWDGEDLAADTADLPEVLRSCGEVRGVERIGWRRTAIGGVVASGGGLGSAETLFCGPLTLTFSMDPSSHEKGFGEKAT